MIAGMRSAAGIDAIKINHTFCVKMETSNEATVATRICSSNNLKNTREKKCLEGEQKHGSYCMSGTK